ncbi:MAG: PH domain-containing protein [Myxococcales bacterium]|nr:PH domain-containing protein [Myxococcales bacterium]
MRDSLFGEEILWQGAPREASIATPYKIAAIVSAIVAVVGVAFAVAISTGLGMPVGGMLGLSAWSATVALLAWRLPLAARRAERYTVTDKRVLWRRGGLRRSIERSAITYAVIRWNPRVAGVGDLVLERAVPAGALRRTLTVTLFDVEAPDRLLAIIRGVEPTAPVGDGSRPLAQRLDAGERVLWTALPKGGRWTARRAITSVGAVLLALSAWRMMSGALPALAKVGRLHALPTATLAVLIGAVGIASLLMLVVTVWVAYVAWVQPILIRRSTRYFVTDRRVLIRRGMEELFLDRRRIAYVISAPTGAATDSTRDLFLVLDGPQARAYSPSGAFGGGDDGRLVPVFSAVDDADTATELLSDGPEGLRAA